jgi:hypothetical protein
MNCISCGAPLRPDAKFCTRCGAKQPVNEPQNTPTPVTKPADGSQPNPITMIKQKIFWNIVRGEIVHRFNEVELLNYDSAQGLIVNDGTTAYIKSNGKLLMVLHGGNYDFINPVELERILQSRVDGKLISKFKRGWRFITNLFWGKKVIEQIQGPKENELQKLQSFDQVIEYMKSGELFSVTLKLDKEFLLVIGDLKEAEGGETDLLPISIRTRYHDIQAEVRAFFHITDFEAFSSYYLGDNDRVTSKGLAQEIMPQVKAVLQELLRDCELKDTRIPDSIYAQIKLRLQTLDFHGLTMKELVEIAIDNEDLERMHALAREMYLSEQEMDYLRRTNDFKNRLATVENQQKIDEARTDLELFRSLQEINKDQLLAQDEFDKFYMVLSREKRIRDAQSALNEAQAMDQVQASLDEIQRTGLLRQEEMEIMKFQIQERAYKRGFAVKLMQLTDAAEYEKSRLGSEQELEMMKLAHQLEIVQAQDKLEEERFYKALQRRQNEQRANLDFEREKLKLQNDQTLFAYDLAERGQRSQMERLQAMERLDAELEDRASERRIKERQQEFDYSLRMTQEQQQTERERIQAQQNMSYEQILAARSDLDATAQAELARSVSAGKNAEREREIAEEKLRQAEAYQDRMERERQAAADERRQKDSDMKEMMMEMMRNMSAMSNNMVQSRNEQREEYREELHREQERHDIHQDRALNYTTRYPQGNTVIIPAKEGGPSQKAQQSMQQNAQPTAEQPKQLAHKECPHCHRLYTADARFCENCGIEI